MSDRPVVMGLKDDICVVRFAEGFQGFGDGIGVALVEQA